MGKVRDAENRERQAAGKQEGAGTMGCYENKEMRRLRTGFFLTAAAVLAGGSLLLLAERSVWQARFAGAFRELYGEFQTEELLALAGRGSYGNLWLFLGLAAAVFAAYFFYMTGALSGICRELRRFSLCLEQMTAGRAVSLAEWKEGILAALSNQAELLYLRNGHMTGLMQQEKEDICRFTENLIHQMKTPLTALRLDLDLMEAKLSGRQESRGEEAGRRIRDSFIKKLADCQVQCGRLQENVDEFLAAGRLAAGKMKLVLKAARMEDIVRGALEEVAPVLEKRGICVSFSSESAQHLYCDYNWLKAAVANVLKNSAESMGAGEAEEMKAAGAAGEAGGRIEIRHWDAGKWKYLEITDEGGGVSEEAGRHLFERFYSGRQGKGGTGLGLAIAREVVEACHGTICVSSVSGRGGRRDGTRFRMKFRLLSGPEAYEE